jgi:hypothetical protein
LGRKKWRDNKLCNFCEIEESADNLFFGCPGARDFRENYVGNRGGRGMGLVWFLFGAVCWTLWLNHNDFVFNNKIISSP